VALLLQILIGVGLGMLAAAKRGTRIDRCFSVSFLVLYSLPSFYLAYLLIAVFSLELGWLPTSGAGPIAADVTLLDRFRFAVLPVTVLALGSTAALARYARGSLLDVINQDFVRTARAKGVAEHDVLWRHVFKNALPQILTVIGLSVPLLLGGAVVVEKIFTWPGMGSLLVDAIFARDYPVVLAVNFVAAMMVIAGNLLADISHAWVDPRVRMDANGDSRAGRSEDRRDAGGSPS
jgi:peptide/nickel transport system permease protein